MANNYYIITKKEFVNNSILDTVVGYTASSILVGEINAIFDASYIAWVNTNKQFLIDGITNISEYFAINSHCYSAYCTTNVVGEGVVLITDINTLV